MAQYSAHGPSPVIVVHAWPRWTLAADRADTSLPVEDLLHLFAVQAVLVAKVLPAAQRQVWFAPATSARSVGTLLAPGVPARHRSLLPVKFGERLRRMAPGTSLRRPARDHWTRKVQKPRRPESSQWLRNTVRAGLAAAAGETPPSVAGRRASTRSASASTRRPIDTRPQSAA